MKSVKIEFPNPMLAAGRDDYIGSCMFHTVFSEEDIAVTADDIVVPIKYTLVCDGIQKLIDNEKAVVVVTAKCNTSSFSRLFPFPKNETAIELHIPKYSVVKRIEIVGAIIAASDIDGYECDDEFNSLYFGAHTFDVRKGDILATENSRLIYIDDSELEKPISSVFNINKVANQEDDVVPDYSEDKIDINLREDLYNLYYNFKDFNNGSLRRYITGIIVYPVLAEAITKICAHYQYNSDEVNEDNRWFRAIEHKAAKIGVKLEQYIDSPTQLANRLLGNVSFDALRNLKDMLESEMNSGESQIIGGVD